jgi:hypothetical protein
MMGDRWSDAPPARSRAATCARVVTAVLLAGLLVTDLIALVNTQPYNGGGECGGNGCMVDRWQSRLVPAAVLLAALLVVVVAWPRLVHRSRRQWGAE